MRVLCLITFLLLVVISFSADVVFADSNPPPETTADSKSENTSSETKASAGSSRLKERLTKSDGRVSTIGVLSPLDYTTLNYGEVAQATLTSSFARYGDFPLVTIDDNLGSLTIDDFRKIITKHKVDIAIVAILKPTNFDMFLFDKRTPYQIYAHSEVLPESVQYQITKEVVEEYTKVIVRRILYAFIQSQSYELPRQESTPVLASEIPRWIASAQSYRIVNREILSSYYASTSAGGALSSGNSKFWSSNLVSVQAGFKLTGNFFLEGSLDLFSYNSVSLSAKYMASNIQSPFRYSFGLGLANLINKYTLNWDQNYTQGAGGQYVVASAAALFPIVDIHFKVEGKAFVGAGGGVILTLTPGVLFMF